jgi:short-subunit dehydrogenase
MSWQSTFLFLGASDQGFFFHPRENKNDLYEVSEAKHTSAMPTFQESLRDFIAGVLQFPNQTFGLGISALHMAMSLPQLWRKKTVYGKVLITGASFGIGKGLAKEAAKSGAHHLVLVGRTKEKLDATVRELRNIAKKTTVITSFVCDYSVEGQLSALSKFIVEQDEEEPFDLIIANAGMSGQNAPASAGKATGVTDPTFYNAIIDTNVKGTLSTVMPLLDRMRKRRSGHIAVTTSVNAYLGPYNQFLYSSTKSFLATFAMDLAQQVRNDGIKVTAIAPGTIDTDMTAPFWGEDQSTMPRFMAGNPDTFGAYAYQDILRGNSYISYPSLQFYQTYLGGTLPPSARETASMLLGMTGMAGKRVT